MKRSKRIEELDKRPVNLDGFINAFLIAKSKNEI